MNFFFFLFFNLIISPIPISNNILRKLQDSEEDPLLFNKLFSKFKEDWLNNMSDFISQYVYLVPVPYKKEVDYYEIIKQVPCLMRGAFLNEDANSENDFIDFKIISPYNKVIFKASSIGEIFSLNLTEKGVYKLSFYNKANNKEVYPTLIMNTGQNLVVEKENLSETEKKFDKIINFLIKNEQENKVNRGFRKKGNESLVRTNKYFFIFSLIETIVLIGVSAWQYYYLKHLFEIKGSL